MSSTRHSRKPPAKPPRKDPLASLRAAELLTASKPVLPLEILAHVADRCDVLTLLRVARCSRRMLEMVYDESRWVGLLRRMGVWHPPPPVVDGAVVPEGSGGVAIAVNGKGRPDAHAPVPRRATLNKNITDGFDAISLSSPGSSSSTQRAPPLNVHQDLRRVWHLRTPALTILERVQSTRGKARQEFGKIYRHLGPFYTDAVADHRSPMECLVFKAYENPEQQAQILSQLAVFARSDLAVGALARERILTEITNSFDTAALLEFRRGYESRDVLGSMRKYAVVLHTLNGGTSSIELFLQYNRIIQGKGQLGSPSDCVDYSSGRGQVSLERTQMFFNRLSAAFAEEGGVAGRVFAQPADVVLRLMEAVGKEILGPFLTSLFDEAHSQGVEGYLKVVSGTFAQTRQFMRDIPLDPKTLQTGEARIMAVMARVYEAHLDLYLAEELAHFKQKANLEVAEWSKALSEQDASTETFLMSNVNRQADKTDFMSSFKKVVMMPVNILPGLPARTGHKSTARPFINGESDLPSSSGPPSRSSTPVPRGTALEPVRSPTPSLPAEAPTTELAAKAALMNAKLETIKSLFSIELALNLVHSAKSSLERTAQFVSLGDVTGEAARQQCTAVFVVLLQILGIGHVKAGFDKAVDRLGAYNPREATSDPSAANGPAVTNGHDSTNTGSATTPPPQVAPLATFLELVNVGDLIQQMLDVFYESELIRLRIIDRDDFMDPAVKEKKKFEAMLDERVAAGLGKGIDALVEEIEYVFATTQQPTDFNPAPDVVHVDVGPTRTARQVIALVSSHTAMLTGLTDKTLLDVFSAEVGLRLFTALAKHLKRQRISTAGALPLLSDLRAYASFVGEFRNADLNSYFDALRAVAQIYLVAGSEAPEMAAIIADADRYAGAFSVDDVLEFAARRADWLAVRSRVERALYGRGCAVM